MPGATLGTYRALEVRVGERIPGWDTALVPPRAAPPRIAFAEGADTLSGEARDAVLVSAWAARRWNWPSLGVPGLPDLPSGRPGLAERRALAVAAVLREAGVVPVPAPAAASPFVLAEPAQ